VNRLKLGLVSCGFLGCSPVAPGTVGTLGGVLIAWALAGTQLYLCWVLLACVALYLLGRSLAPWAERQLGSDPQVFVLDEVLGYLITVAWVRGPSLLTLVVGFTLFRLFDVLKPGPVGRLERIPGGDGILLDDVAAGVLGLVVLSAIRLSVGETRMWEVQ
jgi:phosphatidylglycerophosphatase A